MISIYDYTSEQVVLLLHLKLSYHHIPIKALLLSREVGVGVMCREF